MTQRMDPAQQSPDTYRKLVAFAVAVRGGSLDANIRTLIEIRASQINGCAFCLDMHVKEAKLHGERELRVHHLPVWRESPLFNARERAALAWTEVLTRLPEGGVPDAIFNEVRAEFSDHEMADLTFAIMAINALNRQGIAFAAVPGSSDKLFGLDKVDLA
ncbi:carboxymuconolactone decarboxylase family protein [Sphingomonas crocodyli]|uniref:Carboxymuconolactone decarboxylase family protein n=1 Tax=Sphingomonas crocodyli TaxID=1979270 RepID=A0A437LZZ6_9SPHN|nr:carboxymuconolactone decarboxylase family protein [Sphingomonas crocodyli]RVT90903.1 carboxymuconolactone decarboxylase family protein [Sphingomonas crocodyli]